MKLKTLTASNIPQAMQRIRSELGENAIIVSSLRLPQGAVQLVVALDGADDETQLQAALCGSPPNQHVEKITKILKKHHVPDILYQRLILAAEKSKCTSSLSLLQESFDSLFTFAPLPLMKTKRVFMFTGAPASGKTLAVAKLAVAAKWQHLKVGVISMDTQKAGGIQQLSAFTDLLGFSLRGAADVCALKTILPQEQRQNDLILIDTPGLNPYMATDMAFLADVKRTIEGVEPVLTVPAGLNADESGNIAETFAKLGCTRLVATRLDISHTYGNILQAAFQGGLHLANFGINASPTDPLHTFSAKTLANLMDGSSSELGDL